MIEYIFKKDRGNGRKSKTYYGRYKFDWMPKIKEINLDRTDKKSAESKLRKTLKDIQKEKEGLISPLSIRDAQKKQIFAHLEEFISNKLTTGRAVKHISNLSCYIKSVCNDCDWKYLNDIRADEFEMWRSEQEKSGKTLNEYLSGWNSFCVWLTKRHRLALNPFFNVDRIDQRRKEENRRALSVEEANILLNIASSQAKPGYMLALYIGLRRKEITSLKWSDINLDCNEPYLIVSNINSKNKKSEPLPIIKPLEDFLKEHKATYQNEIFIAPNLPRMRAMRKDWEKAGIVYKDLQGRIANFHCLRRTLCTMLMNAGVPQRTAQAIMRHSDPRLTAMVYTDTSLLNMRGALNSLPSLNQDLNNIDGGAHICAQTSAPNSQNVSLSVNPLEANKILQVVDDVRSCHGLSLCDEEKKMVGVAGFEPATF